MIRIPIQYGWETKFPLHRLIIKKTKRRHHSPGDNGTHLHFLNNGFVPIKTGIKATHIISLCFNHTIGYVLCQNTGYDCVLDLRHYARQDNRYKLIIDCSQDTVFVYKMSMPGQLQLKGLTEIFDRQNISDLIFVKSDSSCINCFTLALNTRIQIRW